MSLVDINLAMQAAAFNVGLRTLTLRPRTPASHCKRYGKPRPSLTTRVATKPNPADESVRDRTPGGCILKSLPYCGRTGSVAHEHVACCHRKKWRQGPELNLLGCRGVEVHQGVAEQAPSAVLPAM